MEMTEFFKGIVDTSENPIVICGLDYKVLYANPVAEKFYKMSGPEYRKTEKLAGSKLELFFNEESMSKIRMTMEWFKEDVKNKKVFAFHQKETNSDMYVAALRDSKNHLIGMYSRMESRVPDTSKEFDID